MSGMVVLSAMAVAAVLPWDASADRWTAVVFVGGMLAVADVDGRLRRIPNRLVGLQFMTLIAVTAMGTASSSGSIARGLAGAVGAFAVFFTFRVLAPGGIGMGDVKESIPLGFGLAWFSVGALVFGIALGFVINGLAGAAMLVSGRASPKDKLPFGPSLAAGAMIALWFAAHQV